MKFCVCGYLAELGRMDVRFGILSRFPIREKVSSNLAVTLARSGDFFKRQKEGVSLKRGKYGNHGWSRHTPPDRKLHGGSGSDTHLSQTGQLLYACPSSYECPGLLKTRQRFIYYLFPALCSDSGHLCQPLFRPLCG